jgi:hypothetical protein
MVIGTMTETPVLCIDRRVVLEAVLKKKVNAKDAKDTKGEPATKRFFLRDLRVLRVIFSSFFD